MRVHGDVYLKLESRSAEGVAESAQLVLFNPLFLCGFAASLPRHVTHNSLITRKVSGLTGKGRSPEYNPHGIG